MSAAGVHAAGGDCEACGGRVCGAICAPLGEAADGWVGDHTPRFVQIHQAFAARMAQQQEQIERIKSKLAERADGLREQSAEIEALVAKVEAACDDGVAAEWGATERDEAFPYTFGTWSAAVEGEKTLSRPAAIRIGDMQHYVEHQCRAQANQRDVADDTVSHLLEMTAALSKPLPGRTAAGFPKLSKTRRKTTMQLEETAAAATAAAADVGPDGQPQELAKAT